MATALTVTQTVEPPAPAKPSSTIRLVAAVQPQLSPDQTPILPVLLRNPLQLLGPAAPVGTNLPTPPATPLAVPIAPNLANTIDGIYTAVEPWVRYGFEVATAVVRWVPYVGWFAGQIMVGYNFGESLVASGVFNFTDWLRGDGTAVQNIVDFGVDVGLAFVWLGLDEVSQVIPLPPFCCYPPRPPVQGPFLAAAETPADAVVQSSDTITDESVKTPQASTQSHSQVADDSTARVSDSRTVQPSATPTPTPTPPDPTQSEAPPTQQPDASDAIDAATADQGATPATQTDTTASDTTNADATKTETAATASNGTDGAAGTPGANGTSTTTTAAGAASHGTAGDANATSSNNAKAPSDSD
jgi:hypothetical protein